MTIKLNIFTFVFHLFFVLTIFIAQAQSSKTNFSFRDTYPESNIDSLEQWLVKHPQQDLTRLKTLIKYERSMYWEKLLQGNTPALEEVKLLSKKLNSKTGMASYMGLTTFAAFFKSGTNDLSKSLLETLLLFESLNDLSGQTNVYIVLYAIQTKTNSEDKNLQLADFYRNKAAELLKITDNEHDRVVLYIADYFNYVLSKNDKLMVKTVAKLNEIILHKPQLRYFEKIINGLDMGGLSKIASDNKDYRKAIQSLMDGGGLVKNNYEIKIKKLIGLGNIYTNLNQYENATGVYKEAIRIYRSSKSESHDSAIEAYSGYRKIVQNVFKDYRLANILADSINYFTAKNFEQIRGADFTKQQTQYSLEKKKIQAELLTNRIKLNEVVNHKLEKNLSVEQQRLKNISLENQLKLNQKELEVVKANTKKQEMTLLANSISKENQMLYYLLVVIGLGIVVSGYFYVKLRKANAQLTSLNQAREKLITIIAHDLKSPMNSFHVFSDVIKHLLVKKDYTKLLEIGTQIEQSGLQVRSLLNNLLAWGGANRNLKPAAPEIISLKSFLSETISYYDNILSARNLTLEASLIENTFVNVDKNSFSLIIRNLLDNAVKYTPNGKSIIIDTKQADSKIHLSIANQYQDLADNRIKEIKKLFSSKKQVELGEGNFSIGLVLANQFAKANQYPINLSVQENNLLVFTIEIPQAAISNKGNFSIS